MDVAGHSSRKQGFDSPPLASSLRPADAGATAGTPAQKPTSSRTAFRLFGRGLSAIVRRPTNGGGPFWFSAQSSRFTFRPADAGATAGTPAQMPTGSRTAFRLFGRGLSAIVRRPTNGGGPLIWPMRHSPFARLKQELRLARQPKSQQVREPRFAFSCEGCPP